MKLSCNLSKKFHVLSWSLLVFTFAPIMLIAAVSETESKKSIVPVGKYNDIALFSRVLNFVEKQYVKPVDTKRIVHGAIKGMLEALDPHSAFLPPEVYHQMKNDASGKFGGLGIEIWLGDDGLLTVVHPIEDTPAWKAGVKSGDKIIKINGGPTKGLSLVEAVSKMRGKIGAPITLTIYREETDEIKDFRIVRSIVKVKSVVSQRINKTFGYIRLNHFQEKSSREMREALKKMLKKGKLKGLVLDLRNNPGGLLDEAVEVTNLFVDDGVIVSIVGRDPKKKEVRKAKSGLAYKSMPVAVLVNANSASAAEIVAGALKDHNRALILGAKTFGKGSVQTVIPLNENLGLKLTIALYYTPNGTSIQARGIEPHIRLDDVDPELFRKAMKKKRAFREADLKGHFERGKKGFRRRARLIKEFAKKKDSNDKKNKRQGHGKLDPETDYQVQQAVGYLKTFDFFERIKKHSKKKSSERAAVIRSDKLSI